MAQIYIRLDECDKAKQVQIFVINSFDDISQLLKKVIVLGRKKFVMHILMRHFTLKTWNVDNTSDNNQTKTAAQLHIDLLAVSKFSKISIGHYVDTGATMVQITGFIHGDGVKKM